MCRPALPTCVQRAARMAEGARLLDPLDPLLPSSERPPISLVMLERIPLLRILRDPCCPAAETDMTLWAPWLLSRTAPSLLLSVPILLPMLWLLSKASPIPVPEPDMVLRQPEPVLGD